MIIEGVVVKIDPTLATVDEIKEFVATQKEKFSPDELKELRVIACKTGGFDVDYTVHGQPFERIRRITGYLTGDLNTWNNAKRAEESERVNHGVEDYERKFFADTFAE